MKQSPPSTGNGNVLHNCIGEILYIFSKHAGNKESSEAKVLAILEAPRIFSRSFHGLLVVKSDLSNVVAWISSTGVGP